ncbi:hypothetical protein B5C26_06605 [Photorhabdus luminescens]|nr:hypothetical protein B5C26_06605 [Photorhabdus luminescens]
MPASVRLQAVVSCVLKRKFSKRTLQNEMAAVRAIFAMAGRSQLANPYHERKKLFRR